MTKKTYAVFVSYIVNGVIEVEADNEEEAEALVENGDYTIKNVIEESKERTELEVEYSEEVKDDGEPD